MARYRTTVTVPTTREETFDYLARFDTTDEWDPGVAEARMITAPPVATGSRFEVVARVVGRRVPLEYEIIEIDRPGRVVLRAQNGAVTSLDTISVGQGARGETRVTYDAVLQTRGPARLFEPLVALAFRRIGDAATAGLVRTLQTRALDHRS
jgi:hypothetical protein